MTVDGFLTLAFGTGIFATLYAYGLFPLLARWMAQKKGPASRRREADECPPAESVTVIVPAYNEERTLQAKLENVLSSDWPPRLLDVIVVSDASTDRTNEIARSFEHRGVRLIAQEVRRGKTAGLNRAIGVATGDIVVFTDANAAYPADAIARMVKRLRDPQVGLVTGYTRYTLADDGSVTEATNAYTRLERAIKRAESAWGNCVGADGAVFAARKALYRPLRDDDINDLVIPLAVIAQGRQCVLEEQVFCTEQSGRSMDSEFRRQSRITNRTLRALWRNRVLLNPWRFPSFSFFLFSHKVVRLLAPWLLLASGVALALLLQRRAGALAGWGTLVTLAAVVALGALAERRHGALHSRFGRLVRLLTMFALTNLAMLHGWCKFLSGNTDTVWQHDRSAP